jgi:predicted XRE-type DNA-binding protein
MDYEKLNELIAERGLKQRFIANGMGISDKRLSILLNGGCWRMKEVVSFCQLLKLTKRQRDEIFFANV